jgi:hypothetical protein
MSAYKKVDNGESKGLERAAFRVTGISPGGLFAARAVVFAHRFRAAIFIDGV